jgi:N-acetylmuramate 1-kinase
MNNSAKRKLHFSSQNETENFARELSLWARPGQVILLSGELGSGKSTFARAFIKALASDDKDFDVPSPTFSLIQLYENTRLPVAHADLYRLQSGADVEQLGIAELLQTHVVLVEWPELLDNILPAEKIQLHFSGLGEARSIDLSAEGLWLGLLERNDQINNFLNITQWCNRPRKFLEGDASSRRYETVSIGTKTHILMDMPQKADGPPVKNGKPYSAIAHLAEGITAVVAVNQQLETMGYSAPHVNICDLRNGLAIIENLGDRVYGRMMRDGHSMQEPMQTAVAVLADMATKSWPSQVKVDDVHAYTLSSYDIEAQMIEVDLLISWFWPFTFGTEIGADQRASFEKLWQEVLPQTQVEKPHWVMRDYHSPNLIWIPEREGLQRVGLIDTQDALLGHPAYDLASLLQDARVDIDFAWADDLYQHYMELRQKQGNFDPKEFEIAFAVLGAQRATKILGIFARLAKRDGKPSYLKHMPRVSRYLARNLSHPALNRLQAWYKTHMPETLSVGKT